MFSVNGENSNSFINDVHAVKDWDAPIRTDMNLYEFDLYDRVLTECTMRDTTV